MSDEARVGKHEGGAAGEEAERLFEQYLGERELSFDRELAAGGRRPDYWIPEGQNHLVVCEVTSLQSNPPGNRAGASDPYKVLRKKLKKKADQGRGLGSERLPYVIVLRGSGSWPPLDDLSVAGAMLGDLTVTMSLNPDTGAASTTEVTEGFGRNGRLRFDQHRHVSAVAVLGLVNPTRLGVELEIRGLLAQLPMAERSPEASLAIARMVFERSSETGAYNDITVPRLTIFRNPYAERPLGHGLLEGPYDLHWGEIEGSLSVLACGRLCRNILDPADGPI